MGQPGGEGRVPTARQGGSGTCRPGSQLVRIPAEEPSCPLGFGGLCFLGRLMRRRFHSSQISSRLLTAEYSKASPKGSRQGGLGMGRTLRVEVVERAAQASWRQPAPK